MTTHTRNTSPTALTLLKAMAVCALIQALPLSCPGAATVCQVSLSTLRRTVTCLENRGLIARTAESTGRHTARLTLTDAELIAILDFTAPAPVCRLLTSAAQPCGTATMPYNHQIPLVDNLCRLHHRSEALRVAADPSRHHPLHRVLLLPDDDASPSPFSDLAHHPDRYADAWYPSPPPAPTIPMYIRESAALTAAWDILPIPPHATSLLYLRTAPTPRATLFVRTLPYTPWIPHPCGAPLSETLSGRITHFETSTEVLLSFVLDAAAFLRPDVLISESTPTEQSVMDTLHTRLSPTTHIQNILREPHRLTLAQQGALLLRLRTLWEAQLSPLLHSSGKTCPIP